MTTAPSPRPRASAHRLSACRARVTAEIRQVIPLWLAGVASARLPSSGPEGESLADRLERTVPAFQSIIDEHRCDADGIVAPGASIGWTVPSLADNVELLTAFTHSLHDTGIIKAVLDGKRLLVTDRDGLTFDVPADRKKPRGCKPVPGHHGHHGRDRRGDGRPSLRNRRPAVVTGRDGMSPRSERRGARVQPRWGWAARPSPPPHTG
ncbi:MAG: hypothetical protein R3F35_20305 [Myxococcota bacterium]